MILTSQRRTRLPSYHHLHRGPKAALHAARVCQAWHDNKALPVAVLKSTAQCQTTDSHKYCEALRVAHCLFCLTTFQRVMVGTAVQGAHENQAEREHQPES